MRVLISAGWHGGAGGAERALHSVLRALVGDRVDVVVRERLGGHLAETGTRVRVFSLAHPRWRAAALSAGWKGVLVQHVLNQARRRLLPQYDVYLQFHAGPTLGATIRADVRLLIPSGNTIPRERSAGFDYVALQAPDNVRFVEHGTRTVLLPPPVFDISDAALPPAIKLPSVYFLTVFNPYGPMKGTEDLARVLDSAPHPIVWCHSQRTVRFAIPEKLQFHPLLVHIDDPSPAELRYLYENCLAYLSFSRSEGFGWGAADGLRYSKAVVARSTGIFSFEQAWQENTYRIGEEWALPWHLLEEGYTLTPHRDLDWISPAEFRRKLLELVREAQDHRP